MKNKILLFFFVAFIASSCGGGGSNENPGTSGLSNSGLTNLNPNNLCKKAWYTTTLPTPTKDAANVFNNFTYFWQSTSLENMPICLNYYEDTTTIVSPWKDYIKELTEYSKYTLGQIVPINVFVLGANPQSSTNTTEKTSYLTDFATVQAPVGANYTTALNNANQGDFPITSAGGGYSDEAAPNGADMQIPQDLIWGKSFGSEADRIQDSFKIISHEYFHTYQNSIKFYNESAKTISIPQAWSNRSLLDNENASIPAYFPWWIEEGGADFGAFVLAAKYANTKDGISTNPAEQFESHFSAAWDHFDTVSSASLADFNLVGTKAYEVGASALMYLWYKDPRNFNAAMSRYYTSWQEAELARSSNGWQDAFEDVFWKNSTQYYTLDDFVADFDNWIRSNSKATLWNTIAKTSNEIIHADIIPTTVNTPNSSKKTIQVEAAAKVVGSGTGNRYFIDGVQQKTLVVKAGETYKFAYPTNHPLRFSSTPNGTHAGGAALVSGITINSATNEITIVMPNSSSYLEIYYFCTAHPNMGGKIIIKDQFTANTSSGSNSSGGSSNPGGSY